MTNTRINPLILNLDLEQTRPYNLRPRTRPVRNIDYLDLHPIANINAPLVPIIVQPNIIMAAPREFSRLAPQKFSGHATDNGRYWIQIFELYCEKTGVEGNDRLGSFILFLTGPATNWYILLPDVQKDTYDHLRAAFMIRFANAEHSVVESDLFHSKIQLQDETVCRYIDDMMSLGNKLNLDGATILATIKRGFLGPIRIHCLAHNCNNFETLIAQATLAENYLMPKPSILNSNAPQRVHFDNEIINSQQLSDILKSNHRDIQQMVSDLTRDFAKMHVNQVNLNNRPRSPAPAQNSASVNERQASVANAPPQAINQIYCTFCFRAGHTIETCRKRSAAFNFSQQFQSNGPRFQNNNGHGQNYNQSFYPRFNNPQRKKYYNGQQNPQYFVPQFIQPQQYAGHMTHYPNPVMAQAQPHAPMQQQYGQTHQQQLAIMPQQFAQTGPWYQPNAPRQNF